MSQTTQATDFAALEVDDPTILPAGFPVGEASDAELQSVLGRPVPPGADSSSGVIALDDGLSVAPSDDDLDYAWRGDIYGLSASVGPDDLYTLSPEFGYTTASSGVPVDYGFLPQQGIDMGTPLSNSYSPRVTGEHRSVGAWEGILRFTGVGQAVSGLWDTVTSLPDYASSYLDAVGAANRDTNEIFRYLSGEVDSIDFESPIAGRIQDDGSVLPILGDTIRGTVLASPLGLIDAGYRGDWRSFGQRLPSLLEVPALARGLGKAALEAPNTNTSLMSSNSGFIGTVDESFVGLPQSEKIGLAFNRIEDTFGVGYANRNAELFNSVRQGSFSSSRDLGLFRASGKKPIIELSENIGNADVLALTILHETRHLRQFNKLQESIIPSSSILTKTDQLRAYNQTRSRWGRDLSVTDKEIFATSTNIWQGNKLGLNADDLKIFQDYYDFYRK
ncbi:hypothetical protein [Candidatus Thiodiazotropha endoloripes]|uniref:hypothetical protein n=1 Tax=Candidatus Thiodiazotropha endoloripes TaxID=1818881 RepID=UPI00111287CB|nr:hypothetical protein [Candidatus Thiodiazotropha endoloripes]